MASAEQGDELQDFQPPSKELVEDIESKYDLFFRRTSQRIDIFKYNMDCVLASKRWFAVVLAGVGIVQVFALGCLYYMAAWRDTPRENVQCPLCHATWEAWTFMADPGLHAVMFLSNERIIGSMCAIMGIMFFSIVVAVVVDFVDERMMEIRRGKSRIIEKNHTLILGWNQKTFFVASEICEANRSNGGGVITVLGDPHKTAMDAAFHRMIPKRDRYGTRIICRTGAGVVSSDLRRMSVHTARSIIILAGTGEADKVDSDTLRTVLGIRNLVSPVWQGHIVAEVREMDNTDLVKTIGGLLVEPVVSQDIIGRLMLMSVRHPGIIKVYEALIGFSGDEFYMRNWPELVGVRFWDLQACFPDAVPIGLVGEDQSVELLPGSFRILGPNDMLIVIAEDDDSYKVEKPGDLDAGSAPDLEPTQRGQELVLFCGWRRNNRDILLQLNESLAPGSEVHMVTDTIPLGDRTRFLEGDGVYESELTNISIVHFYANTCNRRDLEALPIDRYTSCMVLADVAFEDDTMRSDSHSLSTLLCIRDIRAARMPEADPGSTSNRNKVTHQGLDMPVVTEILDAATQLTIAESNFLGHISEFCQSNELLAKVFAMVAEERIVNQIFGELLGSSGASVLVFSSSRYVALGEQISFMSITLRAAKNREIVLGYMENHSLEPAILNPPSKHKKCIWDDQSFAILQVERRRSRRWHNTSRTWCC